MSLKPKVLNFERKKLIFAFILISISFQIFVDGKHRGFKKDSFLGFDFVNSHLQNLKAEANENAPAEKLFRLPKDVKPISYGLKMVPNLAGEFTFFGEVDIELKIENPTSTIILHNNQLDISLVEVFQKERKIDSSYAMSPADQIMTIQIKEELLPDSNARVYVKFKGFLNDNMLGFYRSRYKVGDTIKWLAITQFEAINARWAFPCFDEPGLRAPFKISIARYPHQKAMSNMPLETTSGSDQSIDNRVWDTFQVTPPMPTYLVAFAVSEFNYRTNAAGVVRVWARENAMDDTAYALTQSESVLKNMEAFLGVPYALPKLDVVAVPDFTGSAMENWGLTTYRERLSLFNPKLGDERNKESVISMIVHELSHQWFGDSVTLAWWDYVWLKEGFAMYFQYFLTETVEPSWRMNELFILEVVHYALSIDGISTHSAMNAEVTSLAAIDWKYDAISYDKAACVIRMIEHMVSTSTFKKALQLYQNSRKNSIAEPSNLYEAFEKQLETEGKFFPNDVSLTKVFKKFADQPGYPCILVSRHRVVDRYTINIKQVPYKSPRSWQSITQKTWVVPLTCTKESQSEFTNTQPTMWLIDEKEIALPNEVKKDEWFICNLQQSGYYRVNYEEDNWELLTKQLHSAPWKIHQLNRAQLINDACVFVKDGFLPHHIMFNLLKYLSQETDPIPWYTGLTEFQNLLREHADSKAFTELQHFTRRIIEPYYRHVGFFEKPEDTHTVKTVRSRLLYIACNLDMEEPVAKAHSEFSSNSANLDRIPAYMKETVLCIAIKTSSDLSVWNKMWDLFRNSNYDFEKRDVLFAFGCAKDEMLLKKYLHKLVDPDDHDIRKQDEMIVLRSVTRFSRGVLATINYVLDSLAMVENDSRRHKMVIRLLNFIMGIVQSPEQIHRLENVIVEAGKLNQEKFGDIKDKLINLKANAIKYKAKIDDEAGKIYAALTSPGPSTPKPSSASILGPRVVIFVITILNLLKLNLLFF